MVILKNSDVMTERTGNNRKESITKLMPEILGFSEAGSEVIWEWEGWEYLGASEWFVEKREKEERKEKEGKRKGQGIRGENDILSKEGFTTENG